MALILPFALLYAASLPTLHSGTPLVSQRVEGARRVCIYENRVGSGYARNHAEYRIGAAEPCPFTSPGRRPPAPERIPPLATLRGMEWSGGQRVCRYDYLGTSYRHAVGAGESCPLTPHFFD